FLSNRGQMVLPVTLALRYADGSSETRTLPIEMWNLGDRFTARFATAKPVVGVVLDPTAVLPDIDRANNSWNK
ncbi:MAG: M1 family peptidase, partial [Acidobacteriota bacterium]